LLLVFLGIPGGASGQGWLTFSLISYAWVNLWTHRSTGKHRRGQLIETTNGINGVKRLAGHTDVFKG